MSLVSWSNISNRRKATFSGYFEKKKIVRGTDTVRGTCVTGNGLGRIAAL